ncbi:geminin coiled-coil domain-containing protein 1 [Hemicordylus capensis]|uniref:geminin coiled-coil domain-containing protein 1 n=1 Tax=Hemicordylus capensis TaxID=884348 RepID=UPI002303F7DD|nr:geminin coiled-coil domain-containing protein 1 [Hemicordylus capensis]
MPKEEEPTLPRQQAEHGGSSGLGAALPGTGDGAGGSDRFLERTLSSAAPSCQEPPPAAAAFAGGPVCAPPWAAHSTSAAAKVAPETWLDSVWAAAAGLLDDDDDDEPPEGAAAAAAAAAAGDQSYYLDFPPRDDAGPGDQLSVQLYRNKQLQDTLLQKEEELARLQEENNHLRLFLNSTLVKQLEEKTKKLLWQKSRKPRDAFKSGKRRRRAERPPLPREASHPQKARRNLLGAFSACEEEQPGPHVDSWVLQTLGLKDIDTIDESPSANYNALTLDLEPSSFFHGPAGPTDLGAKDGQPAAYRRGAPPPADSAAADARNEPLPPTPQLPSVHRLPSLPRSPPACLAPCALPCCSEDLPPAQMDMAFTASLSPHCNVKTHTFRQGQAFVRRDEDGGWKLTWVPKQPE